MRGLGTAVLVVEDEALILIGISDELTELGFQVFEASNARAAIDLLQRHPEIEVLFTDIDMPGDMDGLRLARLVRGRWPPIKIIITSGKQCFAKKELPVLGCFIPKPYDPMSVASAIHEVVSGLIGGFSILVKNEKRDASLLGVATSSTSA